MSKGWIKLHRSLLDWEWYDDINATRLLIHLLVSVNYEEKKWKGITIKPGEMVISWETLSNATGLSVMQCRSAMTKLEKSKEITRYTTNKYQLVRLVKWAELQLNDDDVNKQTNKPVTIKQQTNNKQITTTKEIKENKEIKEKKKLEDFKKSLQTHLDVYGKDMLNEFYLYWTEKKPNGKKMRYEMEKTFDISRRLARWSKNDFNSKKPEVKLQKVKRTALTEQEQNQKQKEFNLNEIDKAYKHYIKTGEIRERDEWMPSYLRYLGIMRGETLEQHFISLKNG